MKFTFATSSAIALVLSGAAMADDVFNDDVIGRVNACFGQSCIDGESFDNLNYTPHFKLKGVQPVLEFNDTSSSSANTDWRLRANFNSTNENIFYLQDATAFTAPWLIEAAAPTNAFYLNAFGNLGLGTSLPTADIHIAAGLSPGINFEQTSGPGYQWLMFANDQAFRIRDSISAANAFQIQAGAQPDSIYVENTGSVGIGTSSPSGTLEISADDDFAYFRITAEDAPTNQSVDITFTKGPSNTGEMRYNIVDGDGPEMRLNANGDMIVTGTLTTAGSCSVGCDRVFDAEYDLKTIEEHQNAMWSNGYLPNVGPTAEDGPFNVSDKMGRMLNELEHAHIYIGKLHNAAEQDRQKIAGLEAEMAAQLAQFEANQAALLARLEALEAQ